MYVCVWVWAHEIERKEKWIPDKNQWVSLRKGEEVRVQEKGKEEKNIQRKRKTFTGSSLQWSLSIRYGLFTYHIALKIIAPHRQTVFWTNQVLIWLALYSVEWESERKNAEWMKNSKKVYAHKCAHTRARDVHTHTHLLYIQIWHFLTLTYQSNFTQTPCMA